MWFIPADIPPPSNPLIQNIIETPEPEPPPELTVEEKIQQNYYDCNTDTHYIRADNAQCLPKPVSTINHTAIAQKAVKRAVNGLNSYSYGYCTWHVKNLASWVPNGWGNANQWAYQANSQGYSVSDMPIVGAVAQTSSGALGHVAYVTAVASDQVTISEMNFVGWNKISSRTVHKSEFVYIY